MSAEDVYKTLLSNGNEVGLATVYRVLTQFEAAGLVTRHHFDGGLKTGRVAEFKDEAIENRLQEIAAELGYTLSDYKIVLYGEIKDPEKKQPSLRMHNSNLSS